MLSLLSHRNDSETPDWFELSADVGRNRPNRRPDLIRIESLLANEGDAELRAGDGPTGRWSQTLDTAIRRFQKRSGLKADGWLKPGGPTIEALRDRQAPAFAGFDVPTPDEVDAHHAALANGDAPSIMFAAPASALRPIGDLPTLRAPDRESNASQLDWLDAHQVGLGEVPAQLARYVSDLGSIGVAQARDFVEQFAARWPGERDLLVDGILDRLDPGGQTAFLGAPRLKGQPFGTFVEGGRRPAPVARDALDRYDERLPDELARRTLELRKGEEVGGAKMLAAANDTEHDEAQDGDASNDPQEAQVEPPQSRPQPPELLSPTPDRQIRKDGQGDGAYGVSRDGGTRKHNGIDLVAPPGTQITSPVDGKIGPTFDPYRGIPGKEGKLKAIRIETNDGHRVEVFYVDIDGKNLERGAPISKGDPLGTAQDLSLVYPPNANGPMTNHVHLQIQKDGQYIDPTPLLRSRK
ncbi:MAG: peptidoglycan DD-metalloendopeptidase family protein [Alphaproteobacteria bacterium]|nr:peptidoglycan DD-metalloendopeptidase family protein [Alphaproteobacteria bacterium]